VGSAIDIDITVVHQPWNVYVDPHQLENVILNLALNARDAMQGKGRLGIEFDNILLDDADPDTPAPDQPAGGEYVVLTISDSGCGMTPEVVAQAFEPFFTTKPEGQGTGLGLSMAYGFVKQSGGDIRIYSTVGAGTTLRIYLPRCHDAEPESMTPAPRDTAGGAETILVVEDNPGVQATAISMLSELGYQVISAADGDSALRILESEIRIDLLFTDVVMPGLLSGPALARRARQLFPDMAVLFTSGYTQKALGPDEQLDHDARLLSKPYRREQLAQEVRQALQRDTVRIE
jgi:CheY-like chemotaxis protein